MRLGERDDPAHQLQLLVSCIVWLRGHALLLGDRAAGRRQSCLLSLQLGIGAVLDLDVGCRCPVCERRDERSQI